MSEPLTLSRADLARLLDVTPPVITTAFDEGAPGAVDRGGPGRAAVIEVAPFLRWWIQREVARAGGVGGKLSDVERRLDIELKREKLAQARNEFGPRAAFTEVVREAFTRLRIAVEQMDTRHAREFVALADEPAAREQLRSVASQLLALLRDDAMWRAPNADDAPADPSTEAAA